MIFVFDCFTTSINFNGSGSDDAIGTYSCSLGKTWFPGFDDQLEKPTPPLRRSTLPICSSDSSPASCAATPFLESVWPNIPLFCVPPSQLISFGHLAQRIQPLTKALTERLGLSYDPNLIMCGSHANSVQKKRHVCQSHHALQTRRCRLRDCARKDVVVTHCGLGRVVTSLTNCLAALM